MRQSSLKNIVVLNLAMLFLSTSGPFGRYVDMSPPLTIFWRSAPAALLLLILCRALGFPLTLSSPQDRRTLLLGGFLMGVHWVTYFYALRWSNVAIGMLSLFTYPVLTAFLEPLILKTPFRRIHILLGFMMLIGVYFLVPDFNLSGSDTKAIGMGLLSSLAYSLRNILMKKPIAQYNGLVLMLYQILVVIALLFPIFLLQGPGPIQTQWPGILGLALLTTVIGHTLFLSSFRHLSITTASILSCVQPILGIIIAAIFLKEYPVGSTYIGGSIILLAVLIEVSQKKR